MFLDFALNRTSGDRKIRNISSARTLFTVGLLALFASPAGAAVFSSDDFSGSSLDTSLWTAIDPVGDGSFSVSGGELSISVGAGAQHDIWTSGNYSARVMQPTDDVDFEIEAKFSSLPSLRYQLQGILIEQDAANFIRYDLYSDGTSLHIFSATFSGGSPTVRHDSIVTPTSPDSFLRITRSGDSWNLSLSFDGATWTTVASYSFALNASGVGVYAGNAGGSPPAFTAVIDYVFNTASPIDPEDGDVGGPDTTPPTISAESAVATSDTEVRVTWNTNEPADGLVEYGLTTSYELGSISDVSLSTTHEIIVSGLTPDENYHFRITSKDEAGNSSSSGDIPVSTSALPDIQVWYGDNQTFGVLGDPQWAANILGNVSDPDGISSLSYSLNGAPAQPLNIGPNGNRLQNPGDFNIELEYVDLAIGGNSVEIVAFDNTGLQNSKTVVLNYAGPNIWPADYSIDWSTASSISDVAQVVDGKWFLESDSVRPSELGYDRLIALGDDSWQNYEITAELTVHGLDPLCSVEWCAGGRPLVGVLTRWPGHYYWGSLPKHGWYPMGTLVSMSWNPNTGSSRLEAYKGSDGRIGPVDNSATLPFGTPHMLKVRAETVAGAQRYQAKLWRSDSPEPTSWNLVLDEPASGTSTGSALIVAHHVDVSFGAVSVSSIGGGSPGDTTPPAITSIEVGAISGTSATITWLTDEPATSLVRYGETTSYELGTESSASLVTAHSVTLSGLSPDTLYNIQVSSSDASGNSSDSGNITFTTGSVTTPPTGMVSDNFDTSLDLSTWTFNDPLGDSTYSTTGSQLAISVPGGTAHDIWSNANNAPRMVQAVANGDFEVEVKFDSAVTERYQLQGLVVEQDGDNLLRFDFYSDGSQTHAFAATFTNGSPSVRRDITIAGGAPLYMRVTRATNTWTYEYSYDGTTWIEVTSFDHSINMTSVGVFAGNAGGSAPPFTALVDYFLVSGSTPTDPGPDVTPPVISDVGVSGLSDTAATITWSTDEPSSSEVAFGTTTEYLDGVESTATLVTSHSLDLTGLTPATTYHFQVTSVDSSGNQSVSIDYQFVTDSAPVADTTPPVIFNVVVSDVTSNQATISWDTDEPSSSTVAYGETIGYEIGEETATALVTTHSITIGGLAPETTYHFEPRSTDSSGNTGNAGDFIFETLQAPPAPSSPVNDEFNGTLDESIWSFVDPVGDASVSMTGSQLAINVPAGTQHDLWRNSNDAPRVVQSISDVDFEVEVKFDSALSEKYQLQGLIAEQDTDNLVRMDFYTDGRNTRFFAASFASGSPRVQKDVIVTSSVPAYLRMKRQGDTWTGSYSYDGITWTVAVEFNYSLAVDTVGLFGGNAGNGGSAPAHSALVDYFRNVE